MNITALVLVLVVGLILVVLAMIALAYVLLIRPRIRTVDPQELQRTWEYLAGRAERPGRPFDPLPEALLDRIMVLRSYWHIFPDCLARWIVVQADDPAFHPAVFEAAATAPFRKLCHLDTFLGAVLMAAARMDSPEPESEP